MPDEASPVTTSPEDAIPHPGSIKINVEGAFIVDEASVSPLLEAADDIGYKHDTKDIRLPNHKSVVSHVAVDVSDPPPP